jgi:hypothetical protein
LTYRERQNKLWSGQASLRRSRRGRRKNQTKTMSPFGRRGDIITALERDQYEVLCFMEQSTTILNKAKFVEILNFVENFEIF